MCAKMDESESFIHVSCFLPVFLSESNVSFYHAPLYMRDQIARSPSIHVREIAFKSVIARQLLRQLLIQKLRK